MVSFVCAFFAVLVFGRGLRFGARRGIAVVVAVLLLLVAGAAAPSGLVLSKSIARAILPLGLLWLVLLATLLKRLIVDDGRHAGAVFALVAAVTVLGNEPVGQELMQRLEDRFQDDPFAAGSFDAVVVLGGGAQEAPHPHHELGPSGDRILLGARLWYAKQTPLLVTTGTPIEGFQRPFDSLSATTTMWREIGVDGAAIVAVSGTRTTSEEATAVAKLVAERGWKRVGLVTSAWHLRRAVRLFARAGVDVVPLAADHRGQPTWDGLYSVIPTGNGAYLQQKAVWEWIGAAVGH